DWRSVIVVVLNIPLALLGATVALALTGQSINLMTLGGLALSVGILVDEATVEVENIHTQFEHTPNIARAVRAGNAQTAVPRLLAMLCVLAVPVLLAGWWWVGHPGLGTEILPEVDSGQFQLRVRAPDGTALEETEALAKDVLEAINREAGGADNVAITVTLIGTASYNYP